LEKSPRSRGLFDGELVCKKTKVTKEELDACKAWHKRACPDPGDLGPGKSQTTQYEEAVLDTLDEMYATHFPRFPVGSLVKHTRALSSLTGCVRRVDQKKRYVSWDDPSGRENACWVDVEFLKWASDK